MLFCDSMQTKIILICFLILPFFDNMFLFKGPFDNILDQRKNYKSLHILVNVSAYLELFEFKKHSVLEADFLHFRVSDSTLSF